MSTTTPRVGDQRPGGRAERVRAAVLAAASELLTEVGYEDLRIEDVAARAGVHKTTVYRRWTSKAELTADAATLHSAEAVPIPDTGSLREDLRLLARDVVANIGSTEGTRRSRSIAAAAANSDELAAAMHGFWGERLTLSAAVVDRAVARGELPGTVDARLVIETVIGPLWLRLLLTGEPVTDALADRIVDLVIAGAASH